MNTLIFSKKIPFEANDGENIVIIQDWKAIKDAVPKASFFCLNPTNNVFKTEALEDTPVYIRPINTSKVVRALMYSVFKQIPIHIARYYDPKVLEQLSQIIEENKIDRILCHGLPCIMYAKMIRKNHPSIEIVYRVHNVESRIWFNLSNNAKNWIKKGLFFLIAKQLDQYEANKLDFVKQFVVLNNDEKDFYEKKYPNIQTLKIAIFIPSYNKTFGSMNAGKKNLLITGSMDWKPNIEGLLWFIERVWPKVLATNPEITLTIAGKGIEKLALKNERNKNLIIKGAFNHVEDLFSEATLLVIPLFSGAGIRIKMLEAMEYGIPVISTTKGVEGIEIEDGAIITTNEEEQFSEQIVRIINDKQRLLDMSYKMKSSMSSFYSESKIKSLWHKII